VKSRVGSRRQRKVSPKQILFPAGGLFEVVEK